MGGVYVYKNENQVGLTIPFSALKYFFFFSIFLNIFFSIFAIPRKLKFIVLENVR
jgi:hypothetical protein